MVIVSQDKKRIFNFDNIEYIEITENKTTIRCQIKDQNVWLGNYKTEKRALEVLDILNNQITGIFKKYEMPEE